MSHSAPRNMLSSLIVRNIIGAGGYGHVYRASWEGREAAVKKFFVVQDDVRQSAAIQREIDIMKTLVDRHVIQFYGTAYHEGMLVLIMDYAEGGCLKRAIDGGRVTDWSTKTRIAQEIARGLAYIHHNGIIHRDLKSMNVLLTGRMEVKLCDFGLATLKVRSASSTTTLRGTIRWMAPELFVFRPTYSTKSDIYALGMVMWEMAANCTIPFQHLSSNEMVIRFVHAGEREGLPQGTPDDYCKWVERCWAHDPLERPEASEMVLEDGVPDYAGDSRGDVTMLSASGDVQGLPVMHSSSDGAGVARETVNRTPENVKALLIRANEDDVEALLELASMYENGTGVERDDSLAFKRYLRAAELHSIVAEAKVGDIFYHGHGTPKNHANAAYWRRQAAMKGHSESQLKLGMMYDKGQGVPQDYTEALSWYRKSAEQGNAPAQYNLGVMYEDGRGFAQDYAEALSWYRRSTEQGNAPAQHNLGVMYEHGRGVTQDYSMAVSWYRKSAAQGYAAAQNSLGVMYYSGQGVAQDYDEAVTWFRKSAEQGNASAQSNLGEMYKNGQGVAQDYIKAVSWYRKSAEQGNAAAQSSLGMMYESERGVVRNYITAMLWYRKSANQGNTSAQVNIAKMYESGQGVAQDYVQALSWYHKAAAQGDASAQINIAKMYERGRGVATDYAEAVSRYRMVAEQGNAEAQYNLGLMYESGQGAPQDYAEAVSWYRKSAEQGNQLAQFRLFIMHEDEESHNTRRRHNVVSQVG
ncbi:hypothetical protein BGZ73_002450 [Actinomortierella ambigua]|nr:hypothetical protein BGZ73_002450 [Actinomortierella ambigua]